MVRRAALLLAFALWANITTILPAKAYLPPPLASFHHDAMRLARHVPGAIALEMLDLNSGYHAGLNAGRSMPAASTIKLPVMVEVFNQLEAGRFDLNRRVTLQRSDRDYGSGELCDAPLGSSYPVSTLLEKMIDISDNTATNMLIRLVGRRNINIEMNQLGLGQTHLTGDVHTDGWEIRQTLRTSAGDLVRLLGMMARGELVDSWSSKEMISILEADQINTLLPAPLPDDVAIAHKTGSFFDTLNDAGIVYATESPYVIAVMTTSLRSQNAGRTFIHSISHLAYIDELNAARWRASMGIAPGFSAETTASAIRPERDGAPSSTTGGAMPDVHYWSDASAARGADAPVVQSVDDDSAPTPPPTP